NLFHAVRGDAHARVLHRQHGATVHQSTRDHHAAAGPVELDGVVHQVDEDLLQAPAVGEEGEGALHGAAHLTSPARGASWATTSRATSPASTGCRSRETEPVSMRERSVR